MKTTFMTLALLALSLQFSAIVRAGGKTEVGLDPIYQEVLKHIDRTEILNRLKEMSGALPVTLDGQPALLTERYSPSAKNLFRKYWRSYFTSLNAKVGELAFPTAHHELEAEGHDLEAVFPGKSRDSVIIVVHYDSIGPGGRETSNPGVDDDMTGMAVQLETARVLAKYRDRLHYTVRFVAADYEEWSNPGLEGSRFYARYIQALAESQGFKLIAAIDDEQSGWNCAREGKCLDGSSQSKMLINDCSTDGQFASKHFSLAMQQVASDIGGMPIVTECSGQDSDHYAMWEIGVTALEFGEFSWQNNDHFDQSGGDTYDKIDEDYFFSIAKVGITFAATVVGLDVQ